MGDKVGYAAAVGEDLSSQHQQALERFGLDLTGLIVRPGFKTPRSWLVMEWNGRRTEVSRTELADFRRMRVMPQDLPHLIARRADFISTGAPCLKRVIYVSSCAAPTQT